MYTAFQTFNGMSPKGTGAAPNAPKVLPISLEFSASVTAIDVDLYKENTDGILPFVQSIYIDNKDNASPLEVTIPVTGQRITCPSSSQGTFPIYAVDQFQALFECAGQNPAKVHLCNFAQPYNVWICV